MCVSVLPGKDNEHALNHNTRNLLHLLRILASVFDHGQNHLETRYRVQCVWYYCRHDDRFTFLKQISKAFAKRPA
jgi:hypothetical protein